MLGRRSKGASGGGLTETYIGQGTRIEGTIVASGALRIEGEIDGEIRSEGDVFIAESGHVTANVSARNLSVGGRLTGTVTVAERLELLATGKLVGDATMQTLIVEQGGVLEGHCRMHNGREGASAAASVLESAG